MGADGRPAASETPKPSHADLVSSTSHGRKKLWLGSFASKKDIPFFVFHKGSPKGCSLLWPHHPRGFHSVTPIGPPDGRPRRPAASEVPEATPCGFSLIPFAWSQKVVVQWTRFRKSHTFLFSLGSPAFATYWRHPPSLHTGVTRLRYIMESWLHSSLNNTAR